MEYYIDMGKRDIRGKLFVRKFFMRKGLGNFEREPLKKLSAKSASQRTDMFDRSHSVNSPRRCFILDKINKREMMANDCRRRQTCQSVPVKQSRFDTQLLILVRENSCLKENLLWLLSLRFWCVHRLQHDDHNGNFAKYRKMTPIFESPFNCFQRFYMKFRTCQFARCLKARALRMFVLLALSM